MGSTSDSAPPSGDGRGLGAERDPEFIAQVLRILRPILRRVFRAEVIGMEKLGEGPFLLVSNHNIGAVFEILVLLDAWEKHRPGRPVYGLAHRFPFLIPGVSRPFRRLGGVPATRENASRAFREGASVAAFPGGNHEVTRPYDQRNLCDFGGHRGWAKIALSERVLVVPISISGSHEMNPVLVRSKRLSNLLVVPRLLRVRLFPLTLSHFVYPPIAWFALRGFLSLPAAAVFTYGVFLAATLLPSWPTKIRIRIGEAISPRGSPGDEGCIDALYGDVTTRIQGGMDEFNRDQSRASASR